MFYDGPERRLRNPPDGKGERGRKGEKKREKKGEKKREKKGEKKEDRENGKRTRTYFLTDTGSRTSSGWAAGAGGGQPVAEKDAETKRIHQKNRNTGKTEKMKNDGKTENNVKNRKNGKTKKTENRKIRS